MKRMLSMVLNLSVVIISLFGIFDAGYITWNDARGIIPPCKPPFACGVVLGSSWSHIGPLPLSVLGIFYYGVIFTLGILHFGEIPVIRFSKKVLFRTKDLLLLLTVGGLFFTAYLVSIMAFVLKAWCLYCLFSAGFSLTLFGLVFFIYSTQKAHSKEFVPSLKRVMFGVLYRWIAKPIFFLFDAESVHDMMTQMGKTLGMFSFTRTFTRMLFGY